MLEVKSLATLKTSVPPFAKGDEVRIKRRVCRSIVPAYEVEGIHRGVGCGVVPEPLLIPKPLTPD